MNLLKQNLILALAILLPLLLIVGLVLSYYLPLSSISTNYNLVYVTCGSDIDLDYSINCWDFLQDRYYVVNAKIGVNTNDLTLDSNNDGIPDRPEDYDVKIFIHDIKENKSKEITLEEAQTLSIFSRHRQKYLSPENLKVSIEDLRGLLRNPVYRYVLKEGDYSLPLHIEEKYVFQFEEIGWVLSISEAASF